MADFHKVFTMEGFDKDALPKWQMVPVNGNRYMALRDGAGLTVTSTNPGVLTVTEITVADLPTHGHIRMPLQASDRIFKLHGVAKGAARLQAKSGSAISAELQVETKYKKTVRVSFNFVRDSAGHHTTRVPASAKEWVRDMNWIYNGQANIFVELRLTQLVTVNEDLGTEVMWTPGANSEWNKVIAKGDAGADMNYFLVWEYEQDNTPTIDNTDAGTLGGNCIFEDNAGRAIGVTMAHEMGHYLGCDDHYDAVRKHHLMHGITDERGEHLPKADVNTMNP